MIRPELLADLQTATQVAVLLDKENENLHQRLKELTEENATLKGETGAQQLGFELALIKEKTDRLQKLLFGDSSERRGDGSQRDSDAAKRAGHGPRRQEKLAVEPVAVTLAPATISAAAAASRSFPCTASPRTASA